MALYGGVTSDGRLYLPARFSATVTDQGQLGQIPLAVDVRHAKAVSRSRAVSDLADQLPYAKLAKVKVKGASTVACVLETGKRLNDDGRLTLQEAMDAAKGCKQLAQDLRDWWQRSRAADLAARRLPLAGEPGATEDLVHALSRGSGPAEGALDDVARTTGTWVVRVLRK